MRAPAKLADSLLNVLFILVAGLFIAPALIQAAASVLGPGEEVAGAAPDAARMFLLIFAQHGTLLALTLGQVLSSRGLGLSLAALGLTLADWRREAAVGLRWGLGLLVVNMVASWVSRGLLSLLMPPEELQAQIELEEGAWLQFFAPGEPLWVAAAAVTAAVLLAPVVEEVFFRGYAHAVLRHRFGPRAVWFSAALFAAVHFYVVHVLAVFLLGAALAWLYELRGRLIAPMVAHATVNGLVILGYVLFRTSPGV